MIEGGSKDAVFLNNFIGFLRDSDEIESDDDNHGEGTILKITRQGRSVIVCHGVPDAVTGRLDNIITLVFTYDMMPFSAHFTHFTAGNITIQPENSLAICFLRSMVKRFIVKDNAE